MVKTCSTKLKARYDKYEVIRLCEDIYRHSEALINRLNELYWIIEDMIFNNDKEYERFVNLLHKVMQKALDIRDKTFKELN